MLPLIRQESRLPLRRSAPSILKEGDAGTRLSPEFPRVGGDLRFFGPPDVWNPTVQRLDDLVQRS